MSISMHILRSPDDDAIRDGSRAGVACGVESRHFANISAFLIYRSREYNNDGRFLFERCIDCEATITPMEHLNMVTL